MKPIETAVAAVESGSKAAQALRTAGMLLLQDGSYLINKLANV